MIIPVKKNTIIDHLLTHKNLFTESSRNPLDGWTSKAYEWLRRYISSIRRGQWAFDAKALPQG